MENAAILEVVKTVRVDEENDGIDSKCTNADDRESTEETANSIGLVHSSDTVKQAGITTSTDVCLCNRTLHKTV